MSCNCSVLDKIILGNDESHPFESLDEIEWDPGRWATLNKCSECQQLWHIDIAKANEIGLCVKVESEDDWKRQDITQARIQLMVNNRGGLTAEKCRWKQCVNHCVKGLAFCPQHAYFDMDIKI